MAEEKCRLGSENWITWKFQMRHLLMAKDLWKYVDGSEVLAEDAKSVLELNFVLTPRKQCRLL